MKTQLYRRAALGLTLAALPLLGGCETDEDASVPGLITAAFAEPVVQTVVETNIPPATPATEGPAVTEPDSAEMTAETSAAPPKPAGELSLPPSIRPSSPLAGVIKLAQSGVDTAVLLTYITNSGSTFGLGADEIVYLNDLGMPSEVITRMIEHDKELKDFWANSAAAQAEVAVAPAAEVASTEQTAVAPSYSDPPQPEPVPAEPQPANVTYNYFYDTLSPYGSWISVDGYGMCWQPGVVVINRGWRPYCDGGRWIYTDCGWYWYSDYTWGWAPFHYGRWFSHPRWGWCWYPGYTWGPSWVSWRYTDSYCGWAPLPPAAYYSTGFGFSYYGGSVGVSFGFGLGYDCYTFVPWNRFCNYRPSTYRAPGHRTRQIYNNSTVVNNIINGDNNTIINNGVPLERVTGATKTEIREVAIRDLESVSARSGRRERLEGNGRTLAVHRPQPVQNSFATGSAQNAGRTRPAELQTRQAGEPASDRIAGPRPAPTRPTQREVAPAGGRTTVAGERPAARSVVPSPRARDSVTAQATPTTTASRPAPTPKPIDVPSTRSVSRSTRTWTSENAANRPTTPQATAPSSRQQAPPASSLVVIGKRENSPARQSDIVVTPQTQSRSFESARPETRSSTVNSAAERQSFSRSTAPQRSFSQPRQSSPPATRNWSPSVPQPIQRQESARPTRSVQPQSMPRPSYSAPVQRPSAPARSYTPRPSAPSPAPPISRPAPAPRPQPSAPAMSAPRSAPTPAPASRSGTPSRSSPARPGSRN